jgi:hypothetical protein
MTDRIKSALTAIRRQLDLPANLRGTAKRLEDRFDVFQWQQLQMSIRRFRRHACAY